MTLHNTLGDIHSPDFFFEDEEDEERLRKLGKKAGEAIAGLGRADATTDVSDPEDLLAQAPGPDEPVVPTTVPPGAPQPVEEQSIWERDPIGAIGIILQQTAAGFAGTEGPVPGILKKRAEASAQKLKDLQTRTKMTTTIAETLSKIEDKDARGEALDNIMQQFFPNEPQMRNTLASLSVQPDLAKKLENEAGAIGKAEALIAKLNAVTNADQKAALARGLGTKEDGSLDIDMHELVRMNMLMGDSPLAFTQAELTAIAKNPKILTGVGITIPENLQRKVEAGIKGAQEVQTAVAKDLATFDDKSLDRALQARATTGKTAKGLGLVGPEAEFVDRLSRQEAVLMVKARDKGLKINLDFDEEGRVSGISVGDQGGELPPLRVDALKKDLGMNQTAKRLIGELRKIVTTNPGAIAAKGKIQSGVQKIYGAIKSLSGVNEFVGEVKKLAEEEFKQTKGADSKVLAGFSTFDPDIVRTDALVHALSFLYARALKGGRFPAVQDTEKAEELLKFRKIFSEGQPGALETLEVIEGVFNDFSSNIIDRLPAAKRPKGAVKEPVKDEPKNKKTEKGVLSKSEQEEVDEFFRNLGR